MTAAVDPDSLESLDGVFEVELVAGRGARPGSPPALLIEVPHGATRRRDFEATRRRLVGELPEDLEQFFFVNTDVGSIECARQVARMVTSPDRYSELEGLAGGARLQAIGSVLILRGLVARTLIDLNRVIDGGSPPGRQEVMTPGLAPYVTEAEDRAILRRMHRDYQAAAAWSYWAVCGRGGRALILHTYAPRSVLLDRVDEHVVAALRRAYEPANYEKWERRPDVDLISETVEGKGLAPPALVQALRELYPRIGVEVAENATYRLDGETMGYRHSMSYPGSVLCLEISRELLADPFTPFVEMSISGRKARRMAAPIAAALLSSDRG